LENGEERWAGLEERMGGFGWRFGRGAKGKGRGEIELSGKDFVKAFWEKLWEQEGIGNGERRRE
jgi:hypothetical protein